MLDPLMDLMSVYGVLCFSPMSAWTFSSLFLQLSTGKAVTNGLSKPENHCFSSRTVYCSTSQVREEVDRTDM